MNTRRRPPFVVSALLLCAATLLALPALAAAADAPAFTLYNVGQPSVFSPNDALRCQEIPASLQCDSYQLLATNVGAAATTGNLHFTDHLPKGAEPINIESGTNSGTELELPWECSKEEEAPEEWTIRCTFEEEVKAGGYTPFLDIRLTAPTVNSGVYRNEATLEGGGAAPVTSITQTPISRILPRFAISDLAFHPTADDGTQALEAGGHPWNFTTVFRIPSIFAGPESPAAYQPLTNIKSVGADLPVGFIGNPQAVGTCTPRQLQNNACPVDSRVGTFALLAGGIDQGEFAYTGGSTALPPSAVYRMVTERGYPAEFGFTYANLSVLLYASLVRDGSGYHVRVVSPGIPPLLETSFFALRLFGDPGKLNETGTEPAFLTNPSDCASGPLSTDLEVGLWEHPSEPVFGSAVTYPALTGCNGLQFDPSLQARPTTTAADSPTGLHVDLRFPQHEEFAERATPPLRDAVVTLPEGLLANPALAAGLAGCKATGPEGINVGSPNVGAKGQDLGEPEATEAGEGYLPGSDSHYEDGFYHAASGHCPEASTLGTAEAITPLLEEPVHGRVFLGSPDCSPCSSADAQSGKLLKLFIELNDPKTGVIVKLPGSVSADPNTGRLTATFKDNPQLPVEEIKLDFKSGPRAPLTTPQTCGSYQTTSQLTPWSAPESGPPASPADTWAIASGPGGKPCAPPPNAPKFEAGTTSTQAGAYAPFVLKLSREDGTQRLKALDVTLPPGLTGKLAGVQECSSAAIAAAEGTGGKAEQASPSCPLASELGTVNVGAGSGPDPFYVQGHAYLAGPYKGAPLSMAIITPAVAGPFDLGTVVVRAALFVDPETAQITVKSDPIPQIRAGIPLDVRSIAVNISRNQFTLNPTSCDPKTLAASVIADASTAAVSNPFQVGGCNALAFKPKLQISLKGATKRTGHPALKAVVTYPPGGGYANIARAQVGLPHSEFLDQGNIGKACTRVLLAQQACPAKSIYGKAKAWTPLLDKPLEGPVYLVGGYGYKLPALVAELNGQIRVLLVGKVDTGKNKGIRNTFEAVPDAPVSRFVLEMKGGRKYGLLENSEDICSRPQKANVSFTAQNGKVLQLQPKIANSCGKKNGGGKNRGKKKPVGSSHR